MHQEQWSTGRYVLPNEASPSSLQSSFYSISGHGCSEIEFKMYQQLVPGASFYEDLLLNQQMYRNFLQRSGKQASAASSDMFLVLKSEPCELVRGSSSARLLYSLLPIK
jgi:hypothetical protein